MKSNPSRLLTSQARWARFFRHPLTRALLASFGVALAAGLAYSLAEAAAPKPARIMWPHLLAAAAVMLAYWVYVRVLEGRPVFEFALRGAAVELATGCGIGAAAVVTVLAVLYTGGGYHPLTLNPWSLEIAIPIAEMAFVGVFEEILCRAVIFRLAEESFGSRAALMLSALLFGLAHIPGGRLGALAFIVAMVAGLVFSGAFMLTRTLWLCVGIHAAWNYTLGSIFSISVSGRPAHGLVNGTLSGPEWLTGGAYGLEGSAVTLAVLSLLAAALLWQAGRKGQVVKWRALPPAHASAGPAAIF